MWRIEQMQELPFYNTFFKTVTVPPIELAAKLAKLLGGNLQHIFFNNSGSESNDTVYPAGAVLLAVQGPAPAQDLHRAAQCLSRLDHRWARRWGA